eukprot:TRINITY_DN538_c0_g1_i1.p1 TRINITY_DN538_c0_g1~~TRINITY_DN538_c0_g1_i1.p1  ORF type:complete len:493 (-),score=111.93 TRINITY_DN538_c0_g1_i1:783-2261(-)
MGLATRVTLLVGAVCALSAGQPAVRVALSAGAFDYFAAMLVPPIEKDLTNVSLDTISGTANMTIGEVNCTLSNVVIQAVALDGPVLVFTPQHEAAVIFQGLAANVSLAWSYETCVWPHISDSGTAQIGISNSGAKLGITLGLGRDGHATAKVPSCSVLIGDLTITLHGGASWLYQLFVDLFTPQLIQLVDSTLQKRLPGSAEAALNMALRMLPLSVPLGNSGLALNTTLLSAPLVVSPEVATIDLAGNVFLTHTSGRLQPPGKPSALPETLYAQMLQAFVSSWSVDSGMLQLWAAGVLRTILTRADAPTTTQALFNTSFYKYILPQLYVHFPNDELEYELNCTAPPTSQLRPYPSPPYAVSTQNATLRVWAITGDQQRTCAFALRFELRFSASAAFLYDPTRLCVQAEEAWVGDVLVDETHVGSFDAEALARGFDAVVRLALPQVNAALSARPWPVPPLLTWGHERLVLARPVVAAGPDYSYIAADVALEST